MSVCACDLVLLLSLIGQELSIDQSGLCGEIKVFLSLVTRWEYRRKVEKKKLRDRRPNLAFCFQVLGPAKCFTTVLIFLQGNGSRVEDRCLKRNKKLVYVCLLLFPQCEVAQFMISTQLGVVDAKSHPGDF